MNVGRVLADIAGHIDRNHQSTKGAHATREQHRAWRAAHPAAKAASDRHFRERHRYLDQLRLRVLAIVLRRDPELAADALAEAIKDEE